MSKHTPGPWSTYVNKWPTEVVVRAMFPDETERAEIATTNADNARLIASAPDLLDALKELVQVTAHLDACPATVEQAKAAIAKATGESE